MEMPPPPAKVVFAGNFIENATIIPTSNSTIVMTTALHEGETVLLPFIDTRVGGVQFDQWFSIRSTDDDDPPDEADASNSDNARIESAADETVDVDDYEPLMSATLPLDNALFFAWDYVRDIQVACTDLSNLSAGRLGLEETRLAWSLHFAQLLQEQSVQCVAAIERLVAGASKVCPDQTTT